MKSPDKPCLSNNRVQRLESLLMILIFVGLLGCGQTPVKTVSTGSPDKTTVSEKSYSRIYKADELIGYIGHRKIAVKVGGTNNDLATNSVYDKAFELLGTYDDSGNTKVFRGADPVPLGVFTPEESVRHITGTQGMLRIAPGLQ